jgi:pSer/pThr/pTyr-binding forkhead associated (FHA) protein
MPRLVVNPGSPGAWEIRLKPGLNSLGRSFANDFKIDDASISGSHCQIFVGEQMVTIKDLGSTNGTYVNRAPVQEAVLQLGQTIQLGGVDVLFCGDAPHVAGVTRTASPPPAAMPEAAPPPIAPPVAVSGSYVCKHHPKTAARYFCAHCKLGFCELCVTTRTTGGDPHKFCRHCGTECSPLKVQIQQVREKGFFARIPGVFVYPFRGSGLLILIVSTIVFAALDYISAGLFVILIEIVAIGYLFSFMQAIIHSTAAGDQEMPELPGFDDIFGGFLRLTATVLVSFGLAIVLACVMFAAEQPLAAIAIIPAVALGCLYFPMALLAVAILDSIGAVNPLLVIPAILKAPLQYLVTVIVMGGVFGVRILGDVVVGAMSTGTYTTRSMSELLSVLGLRACWAFASIYLLTANMRLLGLLYVEKKEEFAWF